MHLQLFTPLFVGLTLAGIAALAARSHHQVTNDGQVFKIPPATAYLMIAIGILFVGAPFWPGAAGNMGFLTFASFFWGFALFAVFFGIYLLKYRVIVGSDTVTIGAFFNKRFFPQDVEAVQLKRGSRSAELIISLRSSQKIVISGMLGDFDVLANIMTNIANGNRRGSSSSV
jgi:hypothetical protein